jgi:alkylation response protein AidB-like acyl-CoA dehydrogenase
MVGLSFDRCEISNVHTIFEGTSEIQQLVIARAISGMRVE